MWTISIRNHCTASAMNKTALHDDVIKWKHFPRHWPVVRGIHRSPVHSPHKGQRCGALILSLICAWINGWVNNREAGDLRRHRTHYNVTVMCKPGIQWSHHTAYCVTVICNQNFYLGHNQSTNKHYFIHCWEWNACAQISGRLTAQLCLYTVFFNVARTPTEIFKLSQV